jgi:hypothetical protein
MATLDRLEPAYTAWTPSASGFGTVTDEEYLGRHRRPGNRRRSILALFYVGRHRAG